MQDIHKQLSMVHATAATVDSGRAEGGSRSANTSSSGSSTGTLSDDSELTRGIQAACAAALHVQCQLELLQCATDISHDQQLLQLLHKQHHLDASVEPTSAAKQRNKKKTRGNKSSSGRGFGTQAAAAAPAAAVPAGPEAAGAPESAPQPAMGEGQGLQAVALSTEAAVGGAAERCPGEQAQLSCLVQELQQLQQKSMGHLLLLRASAVQQNRNNCCSSSSSSLAAADIVRAAVDQQQLCDLQCAVQLPLERHLELVEELQQRQIVLVRQLQEALRPAVCPLPAAAGQQVLPAALEKVSSARVAVAVAARLERKLLLQMCSDLLMEVHSLLKD
jgi:hypothetical protein